MMKRINIFIFLVSFLGASIPSFAQTDSLNEVDILRNQLIHMRKTDSLLRIELQLQIEELKMQKNVADTLEGPSCRPFSRYLVLRTTSPWIVTPCRTCP